MRYYPITDNSKIVTSIAESEVTAIKKYFRAKKIKFRGSKNGSDLTVYDCPDNIIEDCIKIFNKSSNVEPIKEPAIEPITRIPIKEPVVEPVFKESFKEPVVEPIIESEEEENVKEELDNSFSDKKESIEKINVSIETKDIKPMSKPVLGVNLTNRIDAIERRIDDGQINKSVIDDRINSILDNLLDKRINDIVETIINDRINQALDKLLDKRLCKIVDDRIKISMDNEIKPLVDTIDQLIKENVNDAVEKISKEDTKRDDDRLNDAFEKSIKENTKMVEDRMNDTVETLVKKNINDTVTKLVDDRFNQKIEIDDRSDYIEKINLKFDNRMKEFDELIKNRLSSFDHQINELDNIKTVDNEMMEEEESNEPSVVGNYIGNYYKLFGKSPNTFRSNIDVVSKN
jgi:hypothetical protein